MGAIASGGVTLLNEEIIQVLHIDQSSIDVVKQAGFEEFDSIIHFDTTSAVRPLVINKEWEE